MGIEQSKAAKDQLIPVRCYASGGGYIRVYVYKPITDLWSNELLFNDEYYLDIFDDDLQKIVQFYHDPEFLLDTTIEDKKRFISVWQELGIHTDNTYFYNYRLAVDLMFENLDTKKLAEIQQIFKLDSDNIYHGVRILELYEKFHKSSEKEELP